MPFGRAIRNSVRSPPGVAMLLLAPGTSHCHEAHPPTEETPAGQGPRIPCPHVEPRWRQGDQGPPSKGPSSADADRKPARPVASRLRGVKAARTAGALGRLRSDAAVLPASRL